MSCPVCMPSFSCSQGVLAWHWSWLLEHHTCVCGCHTSFKEGVPQLAIGVQTGHCPYAQNCIFWLLPHDSRASAQCTLLVCIQVLDRPAGPSTVADDIATRAATGTRPASRHLLQRQSRSDRAGPRNDVAQKLTQDAIRRCVQAANSNRGTPGCTKRATSTGQAAVQIVARPSSVPLTTATAKVANSGRH
ncbi:hypothetical protein COO60DRAFT_1553917, partial [Scenedesmus sp. NREL 46B-D3]